MYTEVAEPSIRAFLTLAGQPPAAPTNTSAPTLAGVAAIGQQLTCSPGEWTGAPTFSYQFVRSTAAGDVGVVATGAQPAYVVTAEDAGTALRCVVSAVNPGGASVASSAPSPLVPGPPPQIPPPNQNNSAQDSHAPVARVTRTACTVTRCTLTVTVSDAGYSAGIKALQASVRSTYRGKCTRHGRRVACTRHRTSRPKVASLSANRFKVVASKLPVGTQLFTLLATDKAGHRQLPPTRKTLKTSAAEHDAGAATGLQRDPAPAHPLAAPVAGREGVARGHRAQHLLHLHRGERRAQAAAHAAAERDPRERRGGAAPSQRSGAQRAGSG